MKIFLGKKAFVGVILALLFLAPFFLQSKAEAAGNVIKWRMQVLWDAATLPYEIEKTFVDRVKELTGGRMEIKIFAPGSLVPTNQMLDAIQKGMFEMTKQYEGYDIGRLPHAAFTSALPCGFTNTWQLDTWFWAKGGIEMLREEYKKMGVYYLAPTIYDEEPIHSKFPINSIADMKGKKARFVGVAGPVLNKLGARVTPMATAEVYSALEKGVIDFADRGGLPANYDVGLYEVAKYIILPGFHQPVTATYYATNLEAWNKLPKDIQAILECAAREAAADLFQLNKTKSVEALEKFKQKGCKVIYLPEGDTMEARKVAMEVWEEYANKSALARKVLDSQKAWMKELGLL
ncbi:MAG: C4-dicarboxylate ABC transporter substrate-binding protein [Proteobacteria bacterium]|nr:C4-dicarboxylate ABC transporter substrate-binding protein [Pseudomonadota bacterium]